MCDRFVLISDLSVITEDFDIQQVSASFSPSRNVSPGQQIPAVIRRDDKNILATFLWGLIPPWVKDPSIGVKLINARAETVNEKPSFKNAFQKRRCLIIADGFYEWKKEGKKKIPYYFFLKSGKPFGFAGLYETWIAPDKIDTGLQSKVYRGGKEKGTQVYSTIRRGADDDANKGRRMNAIRYETCTIITTQANSLVRPIHERMPVIIPKEQEKIWLKNDMSDMHSPLEVLKPYPAEEMECRMVNL